MNDMTFIFVVSSILWLLIDWAKPIWEKAAQAKYISMAVALVGAIALTVTFGLDLLVALELTETVTIIGSVFAALAITAGSGIINEIIKAISGLKGAEAANTKE